MKKLVYLLFIFLCFIPLITMSQTPVSVLQFRGLAQAPANKQTGMVWYQDGKLHLQVSSTKTIVIDSIGVGSDSVRAASFAAIADSLRGIPRLSLALKKINSTGLTGGQLLVYDGVTQEWVVKDTSDLVSRAVWGNITGSWQQQNDLALELARKAARTEIGDTINAHAIYFTSLMGHIAVWARQDSMTYGPLIRGTPSDAIALLSDLTGGGSGAGGWADSLILKTPGGTQKATLKSFTDGVDDSSSVFRFLAGRTLSSLSSEPSGGYFPSTTQKLFCMLFKNPLNSTYNGWLYGVDSLGAPFIFPYTQQAGLGRTPYFAGGLEFRLPPDRLYGAIVITNKLNTNNRITSNDPSGFTRPHSLLEVFRYGIRYPSGSLNHTSADEIAAIRGVNVVENTGSGVKITGVTGEATTQYGSATRADQLLGLRGTALIRGTGRNKLIAGVYGAYGYYNDDPIGATDTAALFYGLTWLFNAKGIDSTNVAFGVYIPSLFGQKRYGFYQGGLLDSNYFAGPTRIQGNVTINGITYLQNVSLGTVISGIWGGSMIGTGYLPSNSNSSSGMVSSGAGQSWMVWKTDANGNPGWRKDSTQVGQGNFSSIGAYGYSMLTNKAVLAPGSNVTITQSNDTIFVGASAAGEANTISSKPGAGVSIVSGKSGVDLQMKRLKPGTNMTITDQTDSVLISTTAEANTISSKSGAGVSVVSGKSGVDLQLKRLKAGANMTITDNVDSVIISSIPGPGYDTLTGFWNSPDSITVDTISGTAGNNWYRTLNGNTTFKLLNIRDGQEVKAFITGASGQSYTSAFTPPAGMYIWWQNGVIPTQTSGNKTDIYVFRRLKTYIYGQAIQNFAIAYATITMESVVSDTGRGATKTMPSINIGSNNNRIIIVNVSMMTPTNATTPSVDSIKSGSYKFTRLAVKTNTAANNERAVEMWYLTNPPANGTITPVVYFRNNPEFTVGTMSFYNVDVASPFSTYATADGNNSTPTVTITSASNELVVDGVGVWWGDQFASNKTVRYLRANQGINRADGAGSTSVGAASVTMSYSITGTDTWVIIAASLRPGQ